MKRTISAALLASLALFSMGCCYRAGGYDPYTGMTYAGQWEPTCCAPFDPFGMCCGPNQWNNPAYGQGYAGIPMQGTCCPQTPCGNGFSGQMLAPQTFATPDGYSNGMPAESVIPGGSMKPAPGVKDDKSGAKRESTMILPVPLPQAEFVNGASAGRWVKSF